MADSEREEKLAAARKRVRQHNIVTQSSSINTCLLFGVLSFSLWIFQLKKFQQKRTPSSSPAVKKTAKNKPQNDSNLSLTRSDSPVETSIGHSDNKVR